MLSYRFLKLASLLKIIIIIFLISVLVRSTALSSRSWVASDSSGLLLNPSTVVFSLLYCILQIWDFGTFLYFLSLAEVFAVFIDSSPEFSEHHYDHYFGLLIR